MIGRSFSSNGNLGKRRLTLYLCTTISHLGILELTLIITSLCSTGSSRGKVQPQHGIFSTFIFHRGQRWRVPSIVTQSLNSLLMHKGNGSSLPKTFFSPISWM